MHGHNHIDVTKKEQDNEISAIRSMLKQDIGFLMFELNKDAIHTLIMLLKINQGTRVCQPQYVGLIVKYCTIISNPKVIISSKVQRNVSSEPDR